jgi:FMN phosphatase YigB (HAD superfamily)
MQKPQWILFDVGGVLLDWRRSSASLAQKLGVTHDQLLDVIFAYAPQMNIGTISPQEGWHKILSDLGKSMEPQTAIDLWRSEPFWVKKSLTLIRDLHGANYELAILSNSWLGLCIDGSDQAMPKELALFSYILDSSVEKMKKPNPAFYDLAEKTVASSGPDIFFIDDDAPNLVPATDKKWQTFHFDMGPEGTGSEAVSALRDILL